MGTVFQSDGAVMALRVTVLMAAMNESVKVFVCSFICFFLSIFVWGCVVVYYGLLGVCVWRVEVFVGVEC